MNKPYPGLGSTLLLLVVALGAQAGAGWGLRLWAGPGLDLTLLAGLANLVALGLVVLWGFWRSGQAPRWKSPVRVGGGFWMGVVLTSAGATVVLGEMTNLVSWLVPLPPELEALFNQLAEGPAWVSLFTLAVVAPLTEEALFRGLIQRGFASRYGGAAAVVMASALFALFHLNVWQALAAFVAGLYLGWIFAVTGAMAAPMAAHAVFNGLPVALATLGFTVVGYNQPTHGTVFQPWSWTLGGAIVLAVGLGMTKRWAPLSRTRVSDTVAG